MRPEYFRSFENDGPSPPLDPPLRAELFSIERLEAHAESLAASQRIDDNPRAARSIATRLDDNSTMLTAAYRTVAAAVAARQPISPAASWLFDNFYIVDEQLRQIRNDLPPGFYRRLPKLADGPLKGYPRVFGISWALVAHTDSAFDAAKIIRFVEAYQRVQPLNIGELWALAITLRITLVENLRRVGEAILVQQSAGEEADALASRIFGTVAGRPQTDDEIVADLAAAPWSKAFAVELAQRLRHQDPLAAPALRWLDNRLSDDNLTSEAVVRGELQWQSATDVTVRNIITSMRLVSTMNWPEVFETVSPVDAVLRQASDFAAMDFPTRDHYRRAIEELAHQSAFSEVEVATRAMAAAGRGPEAAAPDALSERERDPGYYLINSGRPALEKTLNCRIPFGTSLFRLYSDLGIRSYLVMIGLLTAGVLALAIWAMTAAGIAGPRLLILAFVGFVPASDVAVALVNRGITRSIGGRLLPALELRGGITADLRTIIVIPTLLIDTAKIGEQIDRLEEHHLGNPDAHFSFALLSDWVDAATEHDNADQGLLDQAIAGIARLNALYGPGADGNRFFLLHRRRVWNGGENRWIGWERKRGKLRELNRLLRGASDTSFITIGTGAAALPRGIRYVITLDVDTRLPMGTARRLVGKMAHPLNRPDFDARAGLVVRGHGMLQPRVTPSLPIGSEGSLFQRVFSGPNGLDPYALAVSDVYQDLFEEGSFTGKGIYDVDSLEAALKDQFPDSAVLSHDLLEGIFARATLTSDVEVVEEFPSRYAVAAARQHRWVRGDWQLLPWIFGLPRHAGDASARTHIPLMGRWKLLDNLRRSLSAPTALLALLTGWLLPRPAAEVWTACILATIALPPMLPPLANIVPRRSGVSLLNHLRTLRGDFALGLSQSGFLLIFLAHQAWLMIDAVGRTLLRVFVHRRHLLQWVTAAQSRDDQNFDMRLLAAQVAASATAAGLFAIIMVLAGAHTWIVAAPLLTLWIVSPVIAWRASLPPRVAADLLVKPADAVALRVVARRTWRYFEEFITAQDNFLPPDNFQETPQPVVAHRTSPTNIGLYLLSIVSARDFGWIGTQGALTRLEDCLAAVARLERYRGHFFNWYDTLDLRALEPKYVSSVDSGNLAGHLLALRNACNEIVAGPAISPNWDSGLADCATLLAEAAQPALAAAPAPLVQMAGFVDCLAVPAPDPAALAAKLQELDDRADALVKDARGTVAGHGDSEVPVWSQALQANVAAYRAEADALIPWAGFAVPQGLQGDKQWAALRDVTPPLAGLAEHCRAMSRLVAGQPDADGVLAPLLASLEGAAVVAEQLVHRLTVIAEAAKAMFDAMEFGFLFDTDRELLSIGYRCSDSSLDASFYDLLASEARLASFIAIAKGDLPPRHWFRLGRTLTPIDGSSGLISWSGSMFEYLMPSLVMRGPAGSLLEQTNRLIVWRQKAYAKGLGLPWGISESEYNVRDIEQTYQYSSFGVPDLGYKTGLGENAVIAPYASGLASMVDPVAAVRNYAALAETGASGRFGYYEALDYTRSRLPAGATVAIIRAYMAHHQAMVVVGIGNALHDGRMRARFHAEPMVRAAELLLQERMPREFAVARAPSQVLAEPDEPAATGAPDTERRYASPHSRVPRTHLLSNGRFSTMLTATGSGYSKWNDVAITRWREDVTCDERGAYVFVRDIGDDATWSAGYQPTLVEADAYDVTFSESCARIARIDGELTTVTDVLVSSEDDAEVRRVAVTNTGKRERLIDVTSFAEIVLARQADDLAHPAFASMFVETEFVPQLDALLATRRQRSAADPLIWAAHLSIVEGEALGEVQYETARARFIGRARNVHAPIAIGGGWPLSNATGAVLDPVFSLRRQMRVPAGSTVRISFWTLVAESRAAVLALADKHYDAAAFERAATLTWTQAQIQLHHLGITSDEAQRFQRLASHVLFSDPALRSPPAAIAQGAGRPSLLWAEGISGDRPIVLVRIDDDSHLDLVQQALRAHEYWRLKRLAVDLVVVNDQIASYAEGLQAALAALIRMHQPEPGGPADPTGGAVFVLRADLISKDVCALLGSCARAVLYGDRGSFVDQLRRAADADDRTAGPRVRQEPAKVSTLAASSHPELEFFNGFGGFAEDGREYVTVLEGDQVTPAPWLNVIANPSFGFQASADGCGFTWAGNSQQNQLTPWSNDPICDPPGEAIYVRDDETNELWGPTALPIRETATAYTIRHGHGYSRFAHDAHGIALELLQFVPTDDPIKISRLRITNGSGRARTLSVTAYVEWVLGQSRSANAPFVITAVDPVTGAIFAHNRWNEEFGDHVAFADLNGCQTAITGDRTEFLGRDGGMASPRGLLAGAHLSNRVGAGLDPCAALQTQLRLAAGASSEVVFFLGQAGTVEAAQALLAKYRDADLDVVLAAVARQWDAVLGVVQVRTPDRALDILLNRWLPYQTLACRVWARTAFYQSSGAYGFRDQLQDVMALCVSRPDIARAQLLRAASRQFAEGDVQHWWLPESGRGVRTRVSDDRGWLAYCVAHYVAVTGDAAVLDESVPFLEGPVLAAGEKDAFFQPAESSRQASLFDHAALALDNSLAVGGHGLPLMGTGDWNDGMDAVGAGGKGESVWLGWFLHKALSGFAVLADRRQVPRQAAAWRDHAARLQVALDDAGWDGDWYRRAYFDDGAALGSVGDRECRIDSIAQSWAVISGAGDPAHTARAMAALDKYLVRSDERLVLLFEPPFDKPLHDPGYIKGYPPGMRENGGQYTHAATWAVLAFAMQGDGDKAGELLAMLNPIRHADTPAAISRYKVEPYVVAADVYSQPPHVGRGGWTWYTGSAAWLYRAAIEAVLGFRVEGPLLHLDPCIPREWPGYDISFRYHSARYEITVDNSAGVCRGVTAITLDDVPLACGAPVPLVDDAGVHRVLLSLGTS